MSREAQRGGVIRATAQAGSAQSPATMGPNPAAAIASAQLVRSGAYAGLQSVNARTPELLLARYAAPVPGQALTLNPRKWTAVEVDRPMVWRPAIVAQEEVWYAYGTIPNETTYTGAVMASGIASSSGMPGVGGGSCLLSGPGVWWLYNTSGTQRLPGFLLDAMDPAFASQVLNERGTAGEGFTRAVAVVAAGTRVLPVDRQRRAFRFQCMALGGGAPSIWRYGFSNSDISAPGAWYEVGVPDLSAGERMAPIEFSGDMETQRAFWVGAGAAMGAVIVTVTRN